MSLPHDLPRDQLQQNKAIIGDPRNDENLIVAQTHLAFLQFHNKVLEDILEEGRKPPYISSALEDIKMHPVQRPKYLRSSQERGRGGPTPFEQARQIVRWHYQWIVLNDFVRRVVRPRILNSVLRNGRRFYRFENVGDGMPFMPLEHSVAAYRMGHSMIRQSYDYNRVFGFGAGTLTPATLPLLFHFTGNPGNAQPGLPPGAPIPSNWIIDWRRFFDIAGRGRVRPNPARKLDTKLANPLRNLPGFQKPEQRPAALAQRNLLRGSRVGLPTGQAVASRLRVRNRLSGNEIASGSTGEVVRRHGFDRATPLWFYILKEAKVREGGLRLGAVGSRIVTEVFVGLLQGDELSFLNANRGWKPTLPGARRNDFRMADLLNYVGNINPIGERPEDT